MYLGPIYIICVYWSQNVLSNQSLLLRKQIQLSCLIVTKHKKYASTISIYLPLMLNPSLGCRHVLMYIGRMYLGPILDPECIHSKLAAILRFVQNYIQRIDCYFTGSLHIQYCDGNVHTVISSLKICRKNTKTVLVAI